MILRNARGLTLLEVIIATAIMAGGMILVANTWSGNVLRMQRSQIFSTMAHLIDQKMIDIRVEATESAFQSLPEEDQGDFPEPYEAYRWEMRSQPFVMPDLQAAMGGFEGGMDQHMTMLMNQLHEFFEKSMFEVQVTVIYGGAREFRQSATTYFVDHSQEFTIPGLVE